MEAPSNTNVSAIQASEQFAAPFIADEFNCLYNYTLRMHHRKPSWLTYFPIVEQIAHEFDATFGLVNVKIDHKVPVAQQERWVTRGQRGPASELNNRHVKIVKGLCLAFSDWSVLGNTAYYPEDNR